MIEKALHQPMPFTTGGQTITDRLNAAKYSLAGSQLGKTICKATTEELMAPKKKHLDHLLHCTNEPNVSIPQMANLLIDRTQNPTWTVVYKALSTIHNIMCHGNERFSQYLATCNSAFDLGNSIKRGRTPGYDMSNHVKKYGTYISEKIATYRSCAFDFCKVKRGSEDGLLRTMHNDKLLKTLPILQKQVDALLDCYVPPGELNNGVINCAFILLVRDLIRLFACYNDGVINLLEKFFDMNNKEAREALDIYKSFVSRLDKVAAFLSVAEKVGMAKGEIPDLTRAPASLLEALEAHLFQLEGGQGPPAVTASNTVSTPAQPAREEPDLIDIFNSPPQQPIDAIDPFSMDQPTADPFNTQSMYPQTSGMSMDSSSSLSLHQQQLPFNPDFNGAFRTSTLAPTTSAAFIDPSSAPHSKMSITQTTPSANPLFTRDVSSSAVTTQPMAVPGSNPMLNVYNDTLFNGNGDVDTALLSLTNNLVISGGNNVAGRGVEWPTTGVAPMYAMPPANPYGPPMMHMQQWQHPVYQQPPGYGMGAGAMGGYGMPPMRPPMSQQGMPPPSHGNGNPFY